MKDWERIYFLIVDGVGENYLKIFSVALSHHLLKLMYVIIQVKIFAIIRGFVHIDDRINSTELLNFWNNVLDVLFIRFYPFGITEAGGVDESYCLTSHIYFIAVADRGLTNCAISEFIWLLVHVLWNIAGHLDDTLTNKWKWLSDCYYSIIFVMFVLG